MAENNRRAYLDESAVTRRAMVSMLEQLELAVRLQIGAGEFDNIGVARELRKCPHLAQGQVDSLGRGTRHYLNQKHLRQQPRLRETKAKCFVKQNAQYCPQYCLSQFIPPPIRMLHF